jgi:glucosyl-dolichyl phosphate glucuronosyltransferase
MNSQGSTSVIICAYTLKRWHDLVRAVESLHRQTVRPQEIIVVVDHNPALLVRVQAELPDVISVQNDEVRGLSGARNSGLRAASGDILVFLDDDAVAAPNWLEELVQGYADSRVVGIGGSSQPAWDEQRPSWFPEEFNWVVGCTYLGLPVTTATVRNLIGCNMSFRREVFDTVGGFRNGIGRIDTKPLGCEETELCIRASQVWPDRVMLFEPKAKVFHKVPTGRANFGYFFSRCYSEGLAKATVSRFVGARDGLSSEWTYTFKTLPSGVARGLADAASGRDLGGFGRAAAIVAGLAVTTAGYISGRLSAAPLPGEAAGAAMPIGVTPQPEASTQ